MQRRRRFIFDSTSYIQVKISLDKEVLIKADGKKRKIIWKNNSMPINQESQIAKKKIMVKTKLQFGNVLQFYEMKHYHLKVHR